ncbi:hypothetical protein SJAG_05161, partial [Schizosaccharomyces japonicus yFS275]
LTKLWDGPFKILKRQGNTAELLLPPKSSAHPVYNVSRLKPYHGDLPETSWNPDAGAEPQYEVDELLGHTCHKGKWSYYGRWTHYTEDDDSWEPSDYLMDSTIREYWAKVVALGGSVPEGALPN